MQLATGSPALPGRWRVTNGTFEGYMLAWVSRGALRRSVYVRLMTIGRPAQRSFVTDWTCPVPVDSYLSGVCGHR